MTLHFTKMHGLGNDFMVIDGVRQSIVLTPELITTLSHRHTGVGFDQCLLVEASDKPGVDFFYRIFNANGQEVGQCGNGARCLARFLRQVGLSTKNTLTVATKTTVMSLHLNPDETVTVDMGRPAFAPVDIPLNAAAEAKSYDIRLSAHETYPVHALSLGNPHAILQVLDVEAADVDAIGQRISEHVLFPEQTNVGFMQVLAADHIKLRVYERGCRETSACGSGAVAAVAAAIRFHQLSKKVRVSMRYGDLWVSWPSWDESIFLTGPATFVYDGALCES